MRSTIRSVAKEAGVSTATVSMVLRGIDGRTTQETRDRVLETASRLNYLPVKPPTSQNRPIETHIVTLVPEHRDFEKHHLDTHTYLGVVSSARQHGYDVLTLLTGEPNHFSADEKNRYLDRRSDGFIFAMPSTGRWESALQAIADYDIPVVVCFRKDVPPGVAYADMDNERAMHEVVQHLVEHGHRHIAYLAGAPDNFNEQERRRGWLKAMAAFGLEVSEKVVIQGLDRGFVPRPASIASVTQTGVTAVVCYNDMLAVLLWDELKKQGLKVPDDMSITGMDNNLNAAELGITSIAHSIMDVGRLAMEAWIELKNGGDALNCSKLAPVEFIARSSVQRLNPSKKIPATPKVKPSTSSV